MQDSAKVKNRQMDEFLAQVDAKFYDQTPPNGQDDPRRLTVDTGLAIHRTSMKHFCDYPDSLRNIVEYVLDFLHKFIFGRFTDMAFLLYWSINSPLIV